MWRHGYLTINEVFNKIRTLRQNQSKVHLAGKCVRVTSARMMNFFWNGITCKMCGLRAMYFCIEANTKNQWHLNLYALKNGEEILFTKDHIIPVSKGGETSPYNLQTLCQPCNLKKGCEITFKEESYV